MDEYSLKPATVRRAFSRAARGYEDAAFLQREVGQRLIEQLKMEQLAPSRVLDIGAGSGRDARSLAGIWPDAQVVALDLAAPMLRAVNPDLAAVCADAHQLPLAGRSVDLIWSNLALQWCEDLGAVMGEFRRVLRPGGLLLFSTFGPETLNELRTAWAQVDERVHVHGFSDMHDIGDALLQSGFVDPVMNAETLTVTYSEVTGLMRDLKAMGASNVAEGRRRGLTGRRRFEALRKAYEPFRADGVLPATWEVVYGRAWGPQPGAPRRGPQGEVASFSPEDLMASLKNKG